MLKNGVKLRVEVTRAALIQEENISRGNHGPIPHPARSEKYAKLEPFKMTSMTWFELY